MVDQAIDYPAATLANSLALPSVAEHCAIVRSEAALLAAIKQAGEADMDVQLLGGGSNVVAMPRVSGLTALMRIAGIQTDARGDQVWMEVGAGESWQGFVRYCLGQGVGQLANLSLIPGTVGAAPIQNIGAYGVEVGRYIEAVRVLDRRSGEFEWLSKTDCQFDYRDSVFRRQLDNFVITKVRFRFTRKEPVVADYAGIERELSIMGVVRPTAVAVAEAVSRIRRRKLPDPRTIPNAGSFFKNPILSPEQYAVRSAQLGGIAHWSVGGDALAAERQSAGGVKLSAAALIERAVGIDRRRGFRPGVYPWRLQPLVLVHRGGCDGGDVLAVATDLARAVRERFDVQLEIEPRLLGAHPF